MSKNTPARGASEPPDFQASPELTEHLQTIIGECSTFSDLIDVLRVSADSLTQVLQEAETLRQMPYRQYLATPWWQGIRESALDRAGGACQVCNTSSSTLDVHHRTYDRRGGERPTDVIVLCRDCHTLFHENGRLST